MPGWNVHRKTIVSNEWIAARLQMGVAANVGKYVGEIAASKDSSVVALRKKLEK